MKNLYFIYTYYLGVEKYNIFYDVDKEKPTLLTCPDRIEVETEKASERITWTEPTYSDNCGDNATCPLKISPSHYPNTNFQVNSETTVFYTATDPSNQVNEECNFVVKIKKKEREFFIFIS